MLQLINSADLASLKLDVEKQILWQGFLHKGDVALLASTWKSGKTTLLCGLLENLGTGEAFLKIPTQADRAWVISEESPTSTPPCFTCSDWTHETW